LLVCCHEALASSACWFLARNLVAKAQPEQNIIPPADYSLEIGTMFLYIEFIGRSHREGEPGVQIMNQHVIDYLHAKFNAMKADPKHDALDLLKLAVEVSKYLNMNA
jgi:hypothetical protein